MAIRIASLEQIQRSLEDAGMPSHIHLDEQMAHESEEISDKEIDELIGQVIWKDD